MNGKQARRLRKLATENGVVNEKKYQTLKKEYRPKR